MVISPGSSDKVQFFYADLKLLIPRGVSAAPAGCLSVTNTFKSSQPGCHKSLVFTVHWQLFDTQTETSSRPIKACPVFITWGLAHKDMGCLLGG